MTKIKNFSLNGHSYYVQKNVTLLDLINYFNFRDSLLVVEYNKLISNRKTWKTTIIKDEDIIEIITIVGGG